MIIWSRWGIVVLPFIGLGVLLGFILFSLVGVRENSGPWPGVFIGLGLMLVSVGLYFFNREVVDKHLDKPRASVIYEKLAEPVRTEGGNMQTHRVVPVVHPETGQQIWTKPTSTFFFIPVRFWAFVLPAIGLVIFVINLVAVLTRR